MKRFETLRCIRSASSVLALAALVACGGSTTPKDVPADGCTGAACLDGVDVDIPDIPPDEAGEDRIPPPDWGEETDTGPDVDPCMGDCSAIPYGFGCGCERMADCESGWCVLMPDDTRRCSKTCVENCCEGWECQQTFVGGEPISVCMPYRDPLCNKQCLDDGVCGIDALCVKMESMQFCLQACDDTTAPCPDNYTCQDTTNAAGTVTSKQCVPKSNHCKCGPDVDYQVDVDHCGSCETKCEFANAVPFCDEGDCTLTGCLEGYMNLDGKTESGCEYKCTFKGADDRPDGDAVGDACPDEHCFDANCDGLDGVIAKGVFVDVATGDDADNFLGDQAHPFKSIGAAIAFAAAQEPQKEVYVSVGQYREQVNMVDGVNVYGGYNAKLAWTRNIDQNKTQIFWDGQESSAVRAVVAVNIVSETWFDGFFIKASGAMQASASSYGIYVFHCSGGLKIRNNTIEPGNGADGRAGLAGTAGANANNGSAGTGSLEYDGCGFCIGCNDRSYEQAVLPGNGGTSPCSQAGGRGGKGGEHDSTGFMGEAAADNGAAAGGPGGPQKDGGAGGKGTQGTNGPNGNGGVPGGGLNPANLWVPSNGQDGTDGANGKGGGGGGGGGGDSDGFLGLVCYTAGGSGGGGGGGGCGGIAGKGGTGGGGSFGIFIIEASPALKDNVITSGNGGNGGSGGIGGEGGQAGQGGTGGPRSDDDAGGGGPGGAGGKGGTGGAAGGGAGGPSHPIYIMGGSSDPKCDGNTLTVGGFPGVGGQGGAGNANRGADGASTNIFGATPSCL